MATEKISLTRMAMNTDVAYVFGLAIKLQYYFPKKYKPRLEIFVDDEEAKSGQWGCYGADADVSADRVADVRFSALNEAKEFQFGEEKFRIQFIKQCQKEIDYPRGGKTLEPTYEFIVISIE